MRIPARENAQALGTRGERVVNSSESERNQARTVSDRVGPRLCTGVGVSGRTQHVVVWDGKRKQLEPTLRY